MIIIARLSPSYISLLRNFNENIRTLNILVVNGGRSFHVWLEYHAADISKLVPFCHSAEARHFGLELTQDLDVLLASTLLDSSFCSIGLRNLPSFSRTLYNHQGPYTAAYIVERFRHSKNSYYTSNPPIEKCNILELVLQNRQTPQSSEENSSNDKILAFNK